LQWTFRTSFPSKLLVIVRVTYAHTIVSMDDKRMPLTNRDIATSSTLSLLNNLLNFLGTRKNNHKMLKDVSRTDNKLIYKEILVCWIIMN